MKKFLKWFLKLAMRISAVAAVAAFVAFLAERIEELKTWGKEIRHKPYGIYERFVKRPLDCFLSTGALIVFSPILILIALLVNKDLGKPILFKQERIGKNRKPFKLIKFRSMKNAFDQDGVPLPDSERLTKIGSMIRKTSTDELPSLINIIKGDMSIIGPRPLPTNYLPWYTEEEQKRHDVRGGLTGLAQVNGRNSVSWEDRFKYDTEYANNITFINDIKILIKTVQIVFKRSDIGTRGISTPPDFHVYRSGMSEKELLEKEKKIG